MAGRERLVLDVLGESEAKKLIVLSLSLASVRAQGFADDARDGASGHRVAGCFRGLDSFGRN